MDLGGVSLPATTNASGTATVQMSASVPPGTYPITATFAGTPACAASDAVSTVQVLEQPTALTIAFPRVTLTTTAPPTPTTPLFDRTVIVTVKQGSVQKLVYVGKTDPQGRIQVPQSLLAGLPQAGYTVEAKYDGETGYAPSSASTAGLNVIRRGSGTDTITGTPGDDLIIDAGGTNTINGLGGNDTIIAGDGTDTINGGDGNDTIDAGGGTNVVNGGNGDDTITTGSGTDTIDGGSRERHDRRRQRHQQGHAGDGNDKITTGSGADTIDGGPGFDICSPDGGSNSVKNCES